jgi:predicted porin
MKKHLIAAAVAAAVAVPAAAQVTVYGILGAAHTDIETKSGSAKLEQTNTGSDNQQSGNRVGFRGSEDLGGGMKAGFVYELNVGTVAGIGSVRLGYADLGGGFGNVRLGRQDTVTRQLYNGFTSHGNSVFAPGNIGGSITSLGGIAYAVNLRGCAAVSGAANIADCNTFASNLGYGGTRVNGFSYISPKFGGANVVVQYGDTSTDGLFADLKEENKSTNIGLFYTAGPLALAVGQDRVKADSITAIVTSTADASTRVVANTTARSQLEVDVTTSMVGASYDLSAAKLFLTYVDKKFEVDSDPSEKIKDITGGISVPVGSLTLVGSYSDAELKGEDYKDDITGYQLQANYALSKRTRAYAMYGNTKMEFSDEGSLKQKGFTVGVQHNF